MNYPELVFSNWAVAELIEAAARSGMSEIAADTYHRLAEITGASGTDWALGVQARSHALLSDGEARACTARRSPASAGPASVPSWPVRTCCTATICAVGAAAATPGTS